MYFYLIKSSCYADFGRGWISPYPLETARNHRNIKFKDIDETFRLVRFIDKESGKEYSFLTNAHHFPAEVITRLYKERWQVELFFKWIKQHLKVKSFVGTSISAVQTQLWIALCAYLLLAFLKFMSRLELSLFDILRKLQLNLFERRDLLELFKPPKPQKKNVKLRSCRFSPGYETAVYETNDFNAIS